MKTDDCGAYSGKGGSVKCVYFDGKKSQQAYADPADKERFYINKRVADNRTWSKYYVPKESIFFAKRSYRYNKLNPFSQTIVEVQLHDHTPLDYFYVLYRKTKISSREVQIF